MLVEIWSDIACPWCLIGKVRFTKALEQFEHRDEVEVVWRSFELDPDAPSSYGMSSHELLQQKYRVSESRAREMNEHLSVIAATEGLRYRLDLARPGNTFDAHRLTHFAREQARGDEMMLRLMRAYLEEGRVISDRDVLVTLATEVGLDAAEAAAVVNGDAFSAEVRQDEQLAHDLGVNGVPCFVFERQYAISGAHGSDVLLNALRDLHAQREETTEA